MLASFELSKSARPRPNYYSICSGIIFVEIEQMVNLIWTYNVDLSQCSRMYDQKVIFDFNDLYCLQQYFSGKL